MSRNYESVKRGMRLHLSTYLRLLISTVGFSVLLCGLMNLAEAREYKTVSEGQTFYYDLNLDKIAVSFAPSLTTSEQEGLLTSLSAVANPPIERKETPLKMMMVRIKSNADEKSVLATLSALEALPQVEWAAPVLMYDGLEHIPTPRLYIQFSFDMSLESIQKTLDRYGLTLLKRCDDWAENVVYVSRPKGTGVESLDLAEALRSTPGVEWAEPDFNRTVRPHTNDTYYSSQWYLYQTSRHDIHAPEAWAITQGSSSIVISICDVGVQIAHPDLAGHVVTGYDAVDSDSDPTPSMTADDGHGTCCAGIAAAVTNNSVGIAGVAYNCNLLGTRMGYISGSYIETNDTWIVNCINYARDHAKVHSNSWGGGSSSSTINTALTNAKAAGLTILFSSGNSNTAVQWPATQTSVIAVGATNENDYRCTTADWGGGQGSCYGPQLDVVAPGNNQYATDITGSSGYSSGSYYSSFGGTSGACPVAAGVCALILSRNSALIPDSVQAILQRTSNDLVGNPTEDVAGFDNYMGWGRVNAGAAVTAATVMQITVTSPVGGETWYTGESRNITWTSTGITGNVNIEINRAYPGTTWTTLYSGTANDGTQAWTVTTPVTSTARIRITSVTYPTVSDTSDTNFSILAPYLLITAPNGGETWYIDQSQNITWAGGGFTGNVKIELNRAYPGTTWTTLFASTTNDGSEPWTPVTPLSTAARMRITSVNVTTIRDSSNANFTIANPVFTVTTPNGGENFIVGEVSNITWTSAGTSENVKIELNRTYPGATWETLFASTTNDGTEPWTVAGAVSSTARIRITGVTHTTSSDTSNANFTIGQRLITVTAPNGGESWSTGTSQNITWTSQNASTYVMIELNRSYSGGSWETIAASTSNSGTYPWTITPPATTAARIRISSLDYPTVTDVSNNNFTIFVPNVAPVLLHDPLHDQVSTSFPVTAYVTDDASGFVTRFFYKLSSGSTYDSLLMTATGNLNEYAVTVSPAASGSYDYYLLTRDTEGLTTSTTPFTFIYAPNYIVGTVQAYDDGTAERSIWASTRDFAWAAKFNVTSSPYVLYLAQIGISAKHPDTLHSAIQVQVLLADGAGGLPGTVVQTRTAGSIGNVIGGLIYPPVNWDNVLFRDAAGNPLQLTSDFYIAVSNPDTTKIEAFLQDTSSTYAGHSFLYNACEGQWFNESSGDTCTRVGNRMIRVQGFPLLAPVAVIQRSGNDILLNWNSTGAPVYRIYSAATSEGPFTTLEGISSTTSFTDVGAVTAGSVLYYQVKSATQ